MGLSYLHQIFFCGLATVPTAFTEILYLDNFILISGLYENGYMDSDGTVLAQSTHSV